MKFHWFNLMSWPYLPEDFAAKHRSVWVDVDSALYDPELGHGVYHDALDLLEYAAEAGFDGIGVNEHHSNAYGLMPSPQLMAATLTRRTRDVTLLLLGQSIALYNPPTRVAEEMAMLDVMSGGRLVAGFPVGTSMDTNYAMGTNPATLREQYQEAHDLIIKAWTEREMFAWNGEHYKVRYVNVWPRPIQKPHPPIWIPGGGSLETWDFCIENHYNYSYLSFSGYLRAAQLMEGFWQRSEQLGGEFNPYQATFAQQIAIGETDAEARRLYEPHVRYFFDRCLHVYPGFADAPGYRTERTIRAGLQTQLAGGQSSQVLASQLSWDELIEQGFLVAGSPDSVAEQLNTVIEKLRVGHIICGMQIGDLPKETSMYAMDLFTQRVMPQLQHHWSDYEAHWSPQPMTRPHADPRPLRQPVVSGD